eukprot:11629207-Alexandrium_andersonii.AAC.1
MEFPISFTRTGTSTAVGATSWQMTRGATRTTSPGGTAPPRGSHGSRPSGRSGTSASSSGSSARTWRTSWAAASR